MAGRGRPQPGCFGFAERAVAVETVLAGRVDEAAGVVGGHAAGVRVGVDERPRTVVGTTGNVDSR